MWIMLETMKVCVSNYDKYDNRCEYIWVVCWYICVMIITLIIYVRNDDKYVYTYT